MDIPVLRLAVCLFPDVTTLDYQGPMELFSFLSPKVTAQFFKTPPKYVIETTYVAYSLDPVSTATGPAVVPSRTYADAKDDAYDIILVPGGPGAQPHRVQAPLLDFLVTQAPRVKYIISVCTGSWILAKANILNGKRATTNKSSLREIERDTKDLSITWVASARWVVDSYQGVENKLWTGSGVTAGMDLANAFLEHILESKEQVEIIRGIIELIAHDEGDDPFASYWHLVE